MADTPLLSRWIENAVRAAFPGTEPNVAAHIGGTTVALTVWDFHLRVMFTVYGPPYAHDAGSATVVCVFRPTWGTMAREIIHERVVTVEELTAVLDRICGILSGIVAAIEMALTPRLEPSSIFE